MAEELPRIAPKEGPRRHRKGTRAQGGYERPPDPPPAPVDSSGIPPDSAINKVAPAVNEAVEMGDLNLVNLVDLEKRIGLLARIILEGALRAPGHLLSLREKADIALRAVSVFEGSKQQISWREEMLRKPTPKAVEEYEREMQEREKKLTELLIRRKEIRMAGVQRALSVAEVEEETSD